MKYYCEENDTEGINVENNINVSVPFVYPNENEEKRNEGIDRSIELLQKLASYVIPSKNPRLTLTCLCFISGMDIGILFGINNSETALAKVLGVSKQSFSLECKKAQKQFNLVYSTNIKHGATPENYQNNVKKL